MIRYNEPKLFGKCLEFAIFGKYFIEEYLRNNCISNWKIYVKRHLINEDDPNYSPYHFFIEIHNDENDKFIIDNGWIWTRDKYKYRFRPKKLYKLKQREIKSFVKFIEDKEDETEESTKLIKEHIAYHLDVIIKKQLI